MVLKCLNGLKRHLNHHLLTTTVTINRFKPCTMTYDNRLSSSSINTTQLSSPERSTALIQWYIHPIHNISQLTIPKSITTVFRLDRNHLSVHLASDTIKAHVLHSIRDLVDRSKTGHVVHIRQCNLFLRTLTSIKTTCTIIIQTSQLHLRHSQSNHPPKAKSNR